jgi:Dual specificity phosphatase, catalytic domain
MSLARRPLVLLALLLGAGLAAWLGLAWLEREYYGAGANFSLIEPGLYMGGSVPEPPRGTGAVLNLCESDDGYRCTTHRWEPIRDAEPAPDLEWLRRQVDFIAAERKAGRTVFIHCRNGVSRSGMVVVAYLMFEHGWVRDEALDFARQQRPGIRPNPAFMERLADWERKLNTTPDRS